MRVWLWLYHEIANIAQQWNANEVDMNEYTHTHPHTWTQIERERDSQCATSDPSVYKLQYLLDDQKTII